MLVLNGGAEFGPGNQAQDQILIASRRPGPAYLLSAAVARHRPHLALAAARDWFAGLGLELDDAGVLTRADAESPEAEARVLGAGLIYIAGGDPDVLIEALVGTRVGAALLRAWAQGAALGGSSAGAMALCEHCLVPGARGWGVARGLGLVPNSAVLPHFVGSDARAREADLTGARLIGLPERTAAVYSDGHWRVAGESAVTLIQGDTRLVYRPGQELHAMPEPVA